MYRYFNEFPDYIINSRAAGRMRSMENTADSLPYEMEIIADNLVIPWAIAFSDDGRIFFTERPGRIRQIIDGRLQPQPLITFEAPFISEGEGGLMGIALDPGFMDNHFIYAMYSYAEDSQFYNRVVRLIEQDNRAYIDRILMDRIPGSRYHDGGRIKAGPDGKLYITAGDSANPSLAQDITSNAGKVLRINTDGSIPEDNPFPGSPVYSYGHRNPEGLAWDGSNQLYESEHGQTAHDEINRIMAGGNYGWPLVQGDMDISDITVQKPLIHSGDITWAPSGITFVSRGPWQDKLLVTALRGEALLVMTLNEDGTAVEKTESWLENQFGRLREAVEGRDGSIYLATSNMDGRGNLRSNDDKIIRLVPKPD